MPLKVFIGGLLEFNSGKTTFAKDMIVEFEKKLSMKTVPFKPLSGNNLFYHYNEIKKQVDKHGNFLSLDVVELMKASSVDVPLVLANPVHRINTQAIPYHFYKDGSISTFFSKYSSSVSLFQRFTKHQKDSEFSSSYIVNEPIFDNPKCWNDTSLSEPILKQAKDLKYYKNDHEYYTLNSKFYADATESSFNYLKSKAEVIVIESFNNSAHPAWCIRESDVVIIVGPGTFFVFEPDSYFRAIDNFRAINRNKPTTTDEIIKIATPADVYSLSLESSNRKKEIKELVEKLKEKFLT
jgi:predicted P-loop ATPase/GTPase